MLTKNKWDNLREDLRKISGASKEANQFKHSPNGILDFATKHRIFSSEEAAYKGKYNPNIAPYQHEILASIKKNKKTVVLASSQSGKSELILNTVMYYSVIEPSCILVLQPTFELGKSFLRGKLLPLIMASPVLSKIYPDPESKKVTNTALVKKFDGGRLIVKGMNSLTNLKSLSARIICIDEVDALPTQTTMGDIIGLAEERSSAFGLQARILIVSTPCQPENSVILNEFASSTQSRFKVTCPNCKEKIELVFENLIKVEKKVVYECQGCSFHIDQKFKKSLISKGVWEDEQEHETKGFTYSRMISPFISWGDLFRKYEQIKHSQTLKQVFINNALARPFTPDIITGLSIGKLIRQREAYKTGLVFDYVTCGIDIQGNRIEAELVGWKGETLESWGLDYKIFNGQTADTLKEKDSPWIKLKKWLQKEKQERQLNAVFIDSGFVTGTVYNFILDISQHFSDLYVYPSKGSSYKMDAYVEIKKAASRSYIRYGSSNFNVAIAYLNTNGLKDLLFSQLLAEKTQNNYCHFPLTYTETHFLGLLSEIRVVSTTGTANYRKIYTKNEPLDCRVYALAAALMLRSV